MALNASLPTLGSGNSIPFPESIIVGGNYDDISGVHYPTFSTAAGSVKLSLASSICMTAVTKGPFQIDFPGNFPSSESLDPDLLVLVVLANGFAAADHPDTVTINPITVMNARQPDWGSGHVSGSGTFFTWALFLLTNYAVLPEDTNTLEIELTKSAGSVANVVSGNVGLYLGFAPSPTSLVTDAAQPGDTSISLFTKLV